MQQAFPGHAMPADVVVKAPDVRAPAIRRAIAKLHPASIDVNRSHTVARIGVASSASVSTLRRTTVPAAFAGLSNVEVGVTGQTAEWKDAADTIKSDLPPVAAFVLLFAFGLMLVSFRSIVVALKAIVLNLMSVAAAYGVLALFFRGLDPVVLLLLFVILFGLSMDYHVFILSRIRETYDRGATMDEAVTHGIKSTAGVVTSAAFVMVAVFAVFATLSMEFFQQFGIGLSAAILIDATIVRAVLLPATMKLLGTWNWYLPRWLDWLPRLQAETPTATQPNAASATA
jgi:RND superfamily putative drug exporter